MIDKTARYLTLPVLVLCALPCSGCSGFLSRFAFSRAISRHESATLELRKSDKPFEGSLAGKVKVDGNEFLDYQFPDALAGEGRVLHILVPAVYPFVNAPPSGAVGPPPQPMTQKEYRRLVSEKPGYRPIIRESGGAFDGRSAGQAAGRALFFPPDGAVAETDLQAANAARAAGETALLAGHYVDFVWSSKHETWDMHLPMSRQVDPSGWIEVSSEEFEISWVQRSRFAAAPYYVMRVALVPVDIALFVLALPVLPLAYMTVGV